MDKIGYPILNRGDVKMKNKRYDYDEYVDNQYRDEYGTLDEYADDEYGTDDNYDEQDEDNFETYYVESSINSQFRKKQYEQTI